MSNSRGKKANSLGRPTLAELERRKKSVLDVATELSDAPTDAELEAKIDIFILGRFGSELEPAADQKTRASQPIGETCS